MKLYIQWPLQPIFSSAVSVCNSLMQDLTPRMGILGQSCGLLQHRPLTAASQKGHIEAPHQDSYLNKAFIRALQLKPWMHMSCITEWLSWEGTSGVLYSISRLGSCIRPDYSLSSWVLKISKEWDPMICLDPYFNTSLSLQRWFFFLYAVRTSFISDFKHCSLFSYQIPQ